MRLRSPLLLSVLFVLAGVVLPAAQQLPRYVERVEVSRILIDARAVDDFGRPIPGLTPPDFKVKIAGRVARVESALWVGGAAPEPRAEPSVLPSRPLLPDIAGPHAGRLIVFLFQKSMERSRIVGLMRMLQDLQPLLGTLGPDDRVAVLLFEYHLDVWLDFTNDFDRVRQVLAHGILFEEPPPVEHASSLSLVAHLAPDIARRTYSIEEALHLVANGLAPLPGAKSVVLVGHGFGHLSLIGVVMENSYGEASRALQAARASVFCLDVTDADYHSLEAGLQLVAEDTGGFYARTHLFPQQALNRLGGVLAGYYVLFCEMPEGVMPGTHEIEVELARRKGNVLARRSDAR
jgi:VWFA-related protein